MWILLTVRVFNFLLMERWQVILQEPLELLICSVTQVSSITHLFSSELADALFSIPAIIKLALQIVVPHCTCCP